MKYIVFFLEGGQIVWKRLELMNALYSMARQWLMNIFPTSWRLFQIHIPNAFNAFQKYKPYLIL